MSIAEAGAITFATHLVARSPLLRSLAHHPVLVGLCADLVGPDVNLYWDQAVYKKPEKPRRFPWHQDNGYSYVEPQQYLTCWLALTDTTVENGCPQVVPGVHRVGTIRHRFVDPLGFECFTDPEGAVAAPVRAGGVVVFSSLTPHLTGPNTTDGVRKAYILQYAPAGARVLRGDPDAGPPVAEEPCGDPDRQFPVLRGGRRRAGLMAGVRGQVQRRGVERRAAILRAATEVFAAHGYRGASLAMIGERVGLTPAGVLRHFGSKEELLLAVIRDRDQRATAIAEELARMPPLEGLRAVVRYAEMSEAEPGIAALFTVLQAEHLELPGSVRRFFVERARGIEDVVVLWLRQGQEDGSIRRDVDLRRVARELMAFMEGAALMWLLDPERHSLVDLYRGYLDRLADELAA